MSASAPAVRPSGARVADLYGLWAAVWKLLRLRWTLTISGFVRARRRRQFGMIMLGLVILGVGAAVLAGSWGLLGLLRSREFARVVGDITPYVEAVPVVLLSGSFLAVLLTSFGVLLQALYLAGDMEFLLSTPVPLRAVFVTKLLQAILPNLALTALFSLPVLYGLGAAEGYTWVYYPLVPVLLLMLALAAAGLSSLLVMAIVRVVPARRVAEVLGFFGAIISITCSQSGQFVRFGRVSANQATDLLHVLATVNTPWSPFAWPGRALVDLGAGRWAEGSLFLGLALISTGAAFAFSLGLSERLYYTGWASMQGTPRKRRAARTSPVAPVVTQGAAARVSSLLPTTVRALVIKDWRVLRRDLRSMSQLVTPILLSVVYAVALLRGGGEPPPGRGEAPEFVLQGLRSVMLYGNIGIALFVGWTLVSRLAGMGFSHEGRSYWLLKGAPLGAGQLLVSKFIVAFLPGLALGWIFLIAISILQHVAFGELVFALPVVALCLAGLAGINLAFGVAGANMNWEDPRQMVRGTSGCLGSLVSLVFLPVALLFFLGPAVLAGVLDGPLWAGQLIGLGLGGALTLACAFFPPYLVRERVPRIGEG